uniref:CCHC-type domain-containing protein n=1 Tax=Ananas comosus var. bracteatus TaxID=296719 RepID=A0A6V7PI55_ANACO|nr:unnamed protein product [Ananas comosus var. bracteatus]
MPMRDDRDRADWFERGLWADIYRAVHILKLTTFAEVLDRALWAEQGNAHIREEREASEKDGGKKRAQGSSGAQSKSRKPPKYPRAQSKSRGPQRCAICGGNHEPRTCDQREGKCFMCGQAGHISRYCPVRASPAPSVASALATPAHYGGVPPAASSAGRAMVPRQPEAMRSAPSGRVFAAQTQAEEPAEAEDRHVLAGMVLINGVRSRAMFDTGATHSFISRSFARMHDIKLQESTSTWRVSGPGRDFVVRKEYSACPVRLGDWIMPIRMLVLKKLKDFDVILGMDWLSKYYATIHCRNKVITFREPGQEEFTYRACRSSYFAATVSATRARKLVNGGCTAYLATVVEVERTTPTLEELSVVREFPDVFPAELPGMPPDRKIEFVIDLVPGTAPISKAPYRMAPAELKELRAQLLDLLDKKFIRRVYRHGEPRFYSCERRTDHFDSA